MTYLLEDGWDVSFLAFRADTDLRYARALRQRGVAVTVGRRHIESLVTGLQPDLALLCLWMAGEQMLPWLRGLSPCTRAIVDSVDLGLLRSSRRRFGPTGGPSWTGHQVGTEAVREINTYAAADAVLTVSDKERSLVDDLTGTPGLAATAPLAESVPRSTVPCHLRRGVLFIGNFMHLPNPEAVGYLCVDVLPLLPRELLARHPVTVLGHGLTPEVRASGEGVSDVHMVGWVPDLTPYLHRARVVVVPLLHGAGVKGKVLQAFAAGTPVVSTSVGVEGTPVEAGEHALVADEAASFASAITTALTDDDRWHRLADAGHNLVTRHYSHDVARRTFLGIVDTVLRGAHPPGPLVPARAGLL